MNTEPPQLVAHEATTRGVLAFLDFKDVEAFAVLCSFRAANGELEDATWNPMAWWRSALETWIDNSSREYDRAVWTDRIEQKFFGGATIDGRGPRDYSGAPTDTRLRGTGTDRFDRTDGEQTPHYWDLKKVVSYHAGYLPERDGLSPVANYDVELAFGSHDAGGPMSDWQRPPSRSSSERLRRSTRAASRGSSTGSTSTSAPSACTSAAAESSIMWWRRRTPRRSNRRRCGSARISL